MVKFGELLKVIWRNSCISPRQVSRAFPAAVMLEIEAAIARAESRQSCEIRFVVEPALPFRSLLEEQPARARALELFSQMRVWDTEGNNGILFYILLSERKFELVTDREVSRRISDDCWRFAFKELPQRFQEGRWREGALAAINTLAAKLEEYFPPQTERKNELPNQPLVLA